MIAPDSVQAQTVVGFEQEGGWTPDGSLSGYGAHQYSEAGLTVQLTSGLRNPSTSQDGVDGALGTYSIRLRDQSGSAAEFVLPSGGLLSFQMAVRRWDGSPSPDYSVEWSADGGSTWSALPSIDSTLLQDSGWATYQSGEIRSTAASIRIRISRVGGERIMLDDFSWIGYSANPPARLQVVSVNGGRAPSAATPFEAVVQLQDAEGGPVVSGADRPFVLSASAGTLSGTLNAVIQAGSESTTMTGLSFTGVQTGLTLQATDGAGSLQSVASAPFDVLPKADVLVWGDVPSTGLANRTLGAFTVQARRSADNSVDVNYTSTITLSKSSGPGGVSGGLSQPAVDGVARFDEVVVSDAGTHVFIADDGALVSAASEDVVVALLPQIVINEFLADPDLILGDANGDGEVSTSQDEFVEVVNTGAEPLDLTGWTLEDAAGVKHRFTETMILEPGQALVVFGGGAPADIFGDARTVTASSGSLGLNNDGDSITLRDSLGQLVETVTFGSSAGGNQALTRSPDLTGDFAVHSTVDPVHGALYSPGTKTNGSGFRSMLQLTGAPGWRLLSTPVQGSSYGDLLEPFWTQGSAGADYTGGSPNVMVYSSGAFEPVADLAQTIPSGTGLLFYAFADDDYSGPAAAGFPKTHVMGGDENTTQVNLLLDSGASAWNLVGNPYNASLDHTQFGKGAGLESSVYVLDASTGTYLSHNGVGGSLAGGLIAPFHGFWIRRTAEQGERTLTMSRGAVRRGAARHHKRVPDPLVALHASLPMQGLAMPETPPERGGLSQDEVSATLHLTFTAQGRAGWDRLDAAELEPLSNGPAHMVFAARQGESLLDIVNLPSSDFEAITLPIHLAGYRADSQTWSPVTGSASLRVDAFENMPAHWRLIWIDAATGEHTELRSGSTLQVDLQPHAPKFRMQGAHALPEPRALSASQSEGTTRYHLQVVNVTGQSVGIDDGSPNTLPDILTLHPNSPNPFNPTTRIRFDLPEAAAVDLEVFDMLGRRVHTEFRGRRFAPGSHTVTLDMAAAAGMQSGTYVCRIRTQAHSAIRLITLVK